MWVVKTDCGNRAYIEESSILCNKVFQTKEEAEKFLLNSTISKNFVLKKKTNGDYVGFSKNNDYKVVWLTFVEVSF